MKERIAVIFGGKSVEHDISIITGIQCIRGLSKRYEILPIYITHKGEWFIADNLDNVETFFDFDHNVKNKHRATLLLGCPYLLIETKKGFKEKLKIDCALLATHGRNVEDGALQGALESSGVPYTSCGVMSSALCMDKAMTKTILKANDIQTPKFLHFYAQEYLKFKADIIECIIAKFDFPVIVKPANLGSSVGIAVCEDEQSLMHAIDAAFAYDEKVIVEDYIKNAKEFACAVIKIGNNLLASKVEQMCKGDIYTFEEKYIEKKSKNIEKVDEQLEKEIKNISARAYSTLECGGVVRVDFLQDTSKNKLYVNEVNTIPGSLAFNLFDVPFKDLLDTLIIEAKEHRAEKDKDVYLFNSEALHAFAIFSEQHKYSK